MTKGNQNYLFKICLIGEAAVGKTSIRRRYLGEGFKTDFLSTMGADFAYMTSRIEHDGKNYELNWQIWDLAGQIAFRNVMRAYYKGSYGALAIYDITQPQSIEAIDAWISDVQQYSDTFDELPIVLVGNKVDLRDEIPDSLKTVHGFTKSKSLKTAGFIETSAKDGVNIEEAFDLLGHAIIEAAKKKSAEE